MSQQNLPDKNINKAKYTSKSQNGSDRNLVTEQSGLKILAAGLLVSLVLGYLIKSALSPERVAEQIHKAASHIHKNLKVNFKEAQLSLSDGILPRFSVVISNAELEYVEPCMMTSQLLIDELRLPLSVFGLIRGASIVKKIEAEQVVLNLGRSQEQCRKKGIASPGSDSESAPLVSFSQTEVAQKYQNAVDELSINNLKIVTTEYPQYPIEFMDLNLKVSSFEPRRIQVRAKTHLLRDEQVGGYLSYANLFAEYKETTEPQIQAHVFGNWREGHYSVLANYTFSDHFLNVETDVKHIPLSQVLSVLHKYKFIANNFNSKQIWVSGLAHITGDIEKLKQAPLEIRNFQLEGDLGEVSSGAILFTKLEPLEYKPISLDIKNLNLERLLLFLNENQNLTRKNFGDLGTFNGRADILSDKKIHLMGEHSNLEFIFSNKGQRELQIIDKILADVHFDGNQWSCSISKIEPRYGGFSGRLQLRANREFNDLRVNANIDDLKLSPQVQKLMTNEGRIGSLKLNLEGRSIQGNLSHLKGFVMLENMSVEGMTLEKTHGEFDMNKGVIILKTKVESIVVGKDSVSVPVFRKLLPQEWWRNSEVELQDVGGQFHWQGMNQFQWKGFHAQIGSHQRLSTEGSWDELGQLKGLVTIRDGKNLKKFNLRGDREHPVFSVDVGN